MGLVENRVQEFESNAIEQLEASGNLAQDPECKHLTLDNTETDRDKSITETALERDVAGAQNIENHSMEEILKISKETGPNQGKISEDVGEEKGDSGLVNVKVISDFGNLESTSENGMTSLENISMNRGVGSANPVVGKFEPLQIGVTNDSDHLNNEDIVSSGVSGKRKAKSKGPVTSSWSLRSKFQEKPNTPEPINTVEEATITMDEANVNGEKKRRGRKKQQQQQTNTVNKFSKIKSHLKYLLHRIKYEQNLIDAYSAEGWRGQSLEKLKPEKELERAKSHILRYKMRIRDLFQQLDLSFTVGKLPESLFDSQGEIDCEDIFCAKCGSKDLTLDNDIILCDGTCERGFHQFCLEPPLLKEDIPPGDEGWLCPGCDCKVDCIDMLKDFQGTKISITDSWEKIFPEAGMKLDGGGAGSSPDDSEDDDYDPDKKVTADEKVEGDESSSDESTYFSAPDDSAAASPENDKYLGLPSDDSEDDDFDPSAPYQDPDEQVHQESSSSDFTSDSEDLGALREDDIGADKDHPQPSTGSIENSKMGRTKTNSLKDELSCLMEASVEPISSRRRVERLDYKKLNDETFGNSSSDSSDEDFDDTTNRKRRKTDHAKPPQAKCPVKTPLAESNIDTDDGIQKKSKRLSVRARKKDVDGGSCAKVGSASSGAKTRVLNRLGEATTQRLYASFNENHYPERAVKEKLSNELGITIRQVSKWFENARWSFNHRPQMESNNNHSNQNANPIEENLVTNITEENSEKRETRTSNDN